MSGGSSKSGIHSSPFDESVSVVIPVYNGAKYLAQAIDSVLAQTVPAREILVIDDGSTDGSLAVAGQYPSVQVVSQRNAGVSASRNRGLRMASSGWIGLLDQDDFWEKQKLERQIETLRRTPEADVCVGGLRVLNQIRNPDNVIPDPFYAYPPSERIAPLLYTDLRFPPACTLIRREKLLAVGGFDASASPCEDWDLWLRLDQAGARFVGCPEPLAVYRIHGSNTSNNSRKMYRAELRAYDRHIAKRVSPLVRPLHRLYRKSKFIAGIAVVEREQNRAHVAIMLSSILCFPFGAWQRYKLAAHMILTKAHLLGQE